MTPQSNKDKWFMRGKDIILFILGSGAIIVLVHIWELPKTVEVLTSRVLSDEAFANGLDKRTIALETNSINQTNLLNEIRKGQRDLTNALLNRHN